MSDIDINTTFGEYLRKLRLARGITMRGMAAELGYSPSYYGDVERGRKAPFTKDTIDEIKRILRLSGSQYIELLDLAGEWKDKIAPDLTEYIQNTERARIALRTARDHNISDERWDEIIKLLEDTDSEPTTSTHSEHHSKKG